MVKSRDEPPEYFGYRDSNLFPLPKKWGRRKGEFSFFPKTELLQLSFSPLLPECFVLKNSEICDKETFVTECKGISGCALHKGGKTMGMQSGSLDQLGTHQFVANRMLLLSPTS